MTDNPPAFDPTPDTAATAVLPDAPQRRDTRAAPPAKPPAKPPAPPLRVPLTVDLLPAVCTPGYAPRVLSDLTLSTRPQRVALKVLTMTLTARGTQLIDGTPVNRSERAVAWLLEQLALGLPQTLLDKLIEGVD